MLRYDKIISFCFYSYTLWGDNIIKRMHLKRKKKNKKMFFIIFLILIAIFFSLYFVSEKLTPAIKNYSNLEIKHLVTEIITDVIKKIEINDNIFTVIKNDENEISSIEYNSEEINKLLSEVNKNLENKINEIRNQVIFYVPSFAAINNSLLANLGPKIPVKFTTIGNVLNNVRTEVKDYGINNALVTVFLDINIICKVILPISEETVNINQTVQIAMKLIQGKIPNYYIPTN